MAGLSLPEALEYQADQLAMIASGMLNNDKHIEFIDEFIEELYAEERGYA
jgi:hypothetical protein